MIFRSRSRSQFRSSSHGEADAARYAAVTVWLWLVCGMIVLMVAVGGITRLTDSGLSIVQWKPIMGTLPPLNEAQWHEAFDLYKATPQFHKFNSQEAMSLSDFKEIFFWEYVHRLLGRLLGLVYAIPLLVFILKGKLRGRVLGHLLFALLIGFGQGVLGWWMVKSGLVDRPSVSHFRLAAHLGLALFLLANLLWVLFSINPFWTHRKTNYHSVKGLRVAVWIFLTVLSAQIVYGAFTAGLDAGYMYNKYPMMGHRFFPRDGWDARFQPLWQNLISNPATVQFVHRRLGEFLLVYIFIMWVKAIRMRLMVRQRLAFNLILTAGVMQFILGLLTLTLHMPIVLAVAHQVMACLLLGATIMALHELQEPHLLSSKARGNSSSTPARPSGPAPAPNLG